MQVLRRARFEGYVDGKSAMYSLVTSMRPHAVRATCRITDVCEEDLVELKKWRRLNNRTNWAKAVVVLDAHNYLHQMIRCRALSERF